MSDEIGSNDETSTLTDLKSDNFDSIITSGGSLKLSEDIPNASKIEISANTTLDLYGHTLTFSNGSGEYGILVNPGATLTITDTSGTTGSIKKVIGTNGSELAHPVILIGTEDKNATNTEMATLNLQKCNIQTIDANGKSSIAGYGVYAANYSKVTAGEGVEIIAGYSAISGNGNNQVASITITGGEYTSETSAAIFFPSTTTLEVTGGTFSGKTGFDIRAGNVTISDAVISLNTEGTTDKTGTSGPSSWGMGVAVIDNQAYASGTDISVSINNTTVAGATYDVCVGDLNINTENGAFISNNLDNKITLNHKISLEIKDNEGNSLLNYAADSVSSVGRIISSIEGVIEVDSAAKLQNAIEVCSGTIKLTEDIDFSSATTPLKFDKKATLDLNGKTLTLKGDARIEVVAGGDLTITDSSGSIGSIEHIVEKDEHSAIKVVGEANNAAKLTLEKCKIIVEETTGNTKFNGYGIYAADHSQVICGSVNDKSNENVSITAGYSAISGNGLQSDASVTINSGTYESVKYAAVYFPSTGSLTVNGGEFIGQTGFEIRAGNVIISDATITANGNSDNTVPRYDQPTNWGMGIVVFDHKAYAKDTPSGHLDINVFINNVKFEGNANFDIYVGKSPFDKDQASTNLPFKQNNEKTVHDINIIVNDVDFEGKGLYLSGANDVEITNCNFKNINTSAADEKNVNAIYLWDCSGSIIIGGSEETGNTIENVPEISSNALHYGRGIFIYNCDTNYMEISHNKISNIAYNAIQIVSWGIENEPNLYIAYNTIENWDADNDGVTAEYQDGYAGGRAVRIDIQNSYAATIINNAFSKDYENGIEFVSNLGSSTDAKGYDDGNVLKLSAKSTDTNEYNVILDLDGNKLNGKVLEYNNDKQVILDVDAKVKFSEDPKNLFKIYDDDVKVNDLIMDYHLNPTDGGYTFDPTGTLKYVTGYTGFSGNTAMQSGYYLPFRITFDKSNGDLNDLSVTLRGNTDKTVRVSALDSKENEENAYMDVVFFIGSLSSIEITVDTNTNDNTPGVTYVIYLGGLDLEQSVKTAPLVDHGADGNEDKIVTPDDYKVEMGLFYSDVFVLNVTAHDLVQHHNGKNELGYWVGIAIPVPVGIDISKAKYSFSDKPIDSSRITESLNNSDLYSIGDKNYVCFYSNVDADDVKRFIAVDWDGSDDNDGSAPPLYYFVNFDVTYTSDEFKPAPLVDHATEPGKEITLKEYSVKVGTAGITTLYLTAKDVPNHVNGVGTSGYWVGIGFKAPNNDEDSFKKAKIVTGWGNPYTSIVSGNYTEGGFDSKFTDEKGTYFTTYYDVGSSDQDQAYIMIYWDGFEPNTDSDNDRPDIYIIDFTNVSKKSSSGSGGGVPVTPPVTPEEPKEPIIPDSKGNAEIKVDEEKADKLVQKTVTSGSKTVELIDKDSIEGTVTSVTVAVEDLKTISDKIENNQNINSVSIATSAGEIIIEKDVLSDILANTDAETIVVEVVDAKDQLNEEQKKVVGDNPVYDINIRAGSEYITNFNGNSITISIPYELQPGEDPNNLVVYYLKDDGTVEKMKGTYKDGKVSFETNHLSKFVIAYEAQEPVTPDNPDKPTKEDNDNTIYYAIAAIVVILIIVALAYYFLKKKQ